MYEAKLIINGQEFPIFFRMLRTIADHLPEGEQYAPIARALLDLEIPSLTRSLIDNEELSMEERDAIWEKGDLDMKRALVQEDSFRKNLSDAQAEQIIRLNDSTILKYVARWAEELYPDDEEEQAVRLSGKSADALLEFIASHPDENVRRELAENTEAPLKFRPKFADMINQGMEVTEAMIAAMTLQDISCLQNASLDNLKAVANSIEEIKNRKVRVRVMDFLCSHRDPAVRLELAENFAAPLYVLERLEQDEDADVASAARDGLPYERD